MHLPILRRPLYDPASVHHNFDYFYAFPQLFLEFKIRCAYSVGEAFHHPHFALEKHKALESFVVAPQHEND